MIAWCIICVITCCAAHLDLYPHDCTPQAKKVRLPFFQPLHVPTKQATNYLRKYFKNKRRLKLLLVLQRFARWYFVGVAAVHYVPRYPSSRQRREHREYIVGLGGIDAYHKLLDSLSRVDDGFDSEGEAWDVDWDGLGDPLASCYDGGDGYGYDGGDGY